MRILAGTVVGLRLELELALLLPLQCEDGGWGPGWMYKYGSSGIKIGNRGLTTALALNAISALQSPPPQLPLSRSESCPPKSGPESKSMQLRPPRPAIGRPVVSPRIPVTRGLPMGLTSPPPPLRAMKERRFSEVASAKDVYACLFAAALAGACRTWASAFVATSVVAALALAKQSRRMSDAHTQAHTGE